MRRYEGPVLPRISGRRTPDGILLIARGVVWRDLREQIVVGVALLIGVAAVILGAASHRDIGRAIFFTVSTASVFTAGLGQYLLRRRLLRAGLLVQPWPIRLGDTVEMRFHATMRGGTPVTSIVAKFECAEEVTIGSGRDRHKKSATLYSVDLPDARQWSATVPAELPPSMSVPGNAIRWQLRTVLTTERADVPADFEILVMPEVGS